MNKHILFVMDHLANPGKYTQEELEAAADAADDAYDAAADDAADDAAYDAAAYAASHASHATAASYAAVERWVNRYFGLTGENKQDYIAALTTDKVTLGVKQ